MGHGRSITEAQKCFALFEHIYESHPGRDIGVYAEVE